MILRIEPEWVRANDVLTKQKRWDRRKRRRAKDQEKKEEQPREPRHEEMTIDLVA